MEFFDIFIKKVINVAFNDAIFQDFFNFFPSKFGIQFHYQRARYHLQWSPDEKTFRWKIHWSYMRQKVLKYILSQLAKQVVYSDWRGHILHNQEEIFWNQGDAEFFAPFQNLLWPWPDGPRVRNRDRLFLPSTVTKSQQPHWVCHIRAHTKKVLRTEPSQVAAQILKFFLSPRPLPGTVLHRRRELLCSC